MAGFGGYQENWTLDAAHQAIQDRTDQRWAEFLPYARRGRSAKYIAGQLGWSLRTAQRFYKRYREQEA